MLILLDRDETFIASLKHNKIQRKRELNGANNLEFETNREVEFGQRIIFQDKLGIWNEYIIIDYFKTHGEDGVIYEVYNEDSTSELYGFFIEDIKPRNALASNVLGQLLEGTRFEVGYVDDFGKKSFNLYRTSVKAALWKMLEVYQAEIQVRIEVEKNGRIHRYIDLRHSIGRNVGKRFTYKKDIGSIKKTTSTKDLVTALYGFGKGEEVVGEDGQPSGGYGRKIDFGDINGGKKYVADEEARKKYGLGKERVHIFGSVDFDDCEDKEELLELTKEKLKELSKPKITYELNVEDISRYEGYIGEGVDLGDIVLVKDEMIDTLVETRVIAIKDNPIEEVQDSEIVLGNYIKDLSDNMVAYDKLKSIFENDRYRFNDELEKLANGVKSSYMQRILEKFNKELNETGGWVYAEEGEGLLILNAPREGNPTQAINLKGGMIAIANHKNADGSFAYETFGDGSGFTANLIRAGVLRGGKVFFNLEDGTFLIGESRTNYSMFWDGTTLHLRGVDIDLENYQEIKTIKGDIEKTERVLIQHKTEQGQIYTKIANLDSKVEQEIIETADSFNRKILDVEQGLGSQIKQTADEIDTSLVDLEKGLTAKITQTAGEINTSLEDTKSGLEAKIRQTAGQFDTSLKDSEAGLEAKIIQSAKTINQTLTDTKAGLESKITQTASEINTSLEDVEDGLEAKIIQTAKTINQTLSDTKAGLESEIKQTASSFSRTLTDTKSGLQSQITQNADKLTSTVSSINGLNTKVTQTADKLETTAKSVNGLSSKITQTANSISSKVYKGDIISEINQSPERIKIKANRLDINIGSIESQLVTLKADMKGVKLGVSDVKSGLSTEIKARKDGITSAVANAKSQLRSEFKQTTDGLSSRVGSLSSRVSSAESSITQTKSMISSRVTSSEARSIFRQEARSFTFDADQVNFNSSVNVYGTFSTTGRTYWGGSYKTVTTKMKEGSIKFYDSYGSMNGEIFGADGLSISSDDSVTINCTSGVNIWSNKIKIRGATEISNGRLTCDNIDADGKISCYNIDAGSIDINKITIRNWSIGATSSEQQLYIIAPNGKRWNFDKYEGFFES